MAKIFLDPGHGGQDFGAIGNDLREKDLVLDIATRIQQQLGDFNEVEVQLSREDDSDLSLNERTELANDWDADIFISVHVNASGQTGFESFIWNGNVSSVTQSYQNIIHAAIMNEIGGTDRGKKRANFAVLRTSKMPAILTENLFIDRTEDADRLRSNQFLESVAQGHTNGIVEIFGLEQGDSPSNPTPQPPSGTIATIQSTLNSRYGLNIAVDNMFGPETKQALIMGLQTELNTQFNAGLVVDGIWGPQTRGAIVNVRSGARGNITWILQAILHIRGHSPGNIDGIFGPLTRAAVRSFQQDVGITVDAIAGVQTFTMLFR